MGRVIVGDEVELEIRRMCEELQRRAIAGTVAWTLAKPGVQALIEGRSVFVVSGSVVPDTKPGTKKRDLAEERRAWFEDWYRCLGFAITVPRPSVTNREFARRAKRGQALVYRPATSKVSYEAFMAAVGQGDHWTVTDQGDRAKIDWELCGQGYWFWTDVRDDCPRLGMIWNDLVEQIRLLSLEEYVIVWHATKAETSRMLDVRTWNLLRTRFGPGVLRVDGCVGGVHVLKSLVGGLSVPYGIGGGRALDVVG